MTVSLSGMSLYTNGDNEGGYDGTTAGPDSFNVSIQGTNSESWNVAKNSTETSTLTKSGVFNTTRSLYLMWMKSDVSYYYTDIELILRSSAGNEKSFIVATAAAPEISGDFKASAIDFVNKGTETGTYDPTNHADSVVVVDNSSSGNIRSVVNNWIDAIYYGAGHAIAGTTVSDKLFTEAAAEDELVANKYGILADIDGVVYSQGDITLTGTALTSNGETLVFRDTLNGYDRYNLDGSGTVTLENTAIQASGAVDFDMDMSSMTAFSMTGGSITQANVLTIGSGQTLSGVVITDVNDSQISNTPVNCVWNQSGAVDVTGGTLDNPTLNEGTGTEAVIATSLTDIDGGVFISNGTGHAVDLGTGVTTQSMTWNSTLTGYASTDGSTGNEAIKVAVANDNTLTINVTAGTTPTIYNASAGNGIVVVSASVSVEVTVTNSAGTPLVGETVYLKTTGGTVVLDGVTNGSGVLSGSYGGTTPISIDTDVSGVKSGSGVTPYQYFTLGGQITSSGYSQTALMSED